MSSLKPAHSPPPITSTAATASPHTEVSNPPTLLRGVARGFERLLWESRLVGLVAVVATALLALGAFYLSTVDVAYILVHLAGYADPSMTAEARLHLRGDTVTKIVKVVDGYLLAAITLVFSLGLYELFINKIEQAERSEVAGRVLLVRSFDDLKDRLAKVVLLILVVTFLQQALDMKYSTPLDLLYLGLGILFVGGALFLSSRKGGASVRE